MKDAEEHPTPPDDAGGYPTSVPQTRVSDVVLSAGPKLMIVDDKLDELLQYRDYFTGKGFEVIAVRIGIEGMLAQPSRDGIEHVFSESQFSELLRHKNPDCLLTDCAMGTGEIRLGEGPADMGPGHGYTVLKLARELKPDMPMAIHSSDSYGKIPAVAHQQARSSGYMMIAKGNEANPAPLERLAQHFQRGLRVSEQTPG